MKLPKLDELLGLDKFNLTESQKQDCRSLANHRGIDAAIEQAKKFSSNAPVMRRSGTRKTKLGHIDNPLNLGGFGIMP